MNQSREKSFFPNHDSDLPHSGEVLVIVKIVMAVMSSSVKTDIGAAYTSNCKEVNEQNILKKLGHP